MVPMRVRSHNQEVGTEGHYKLNLCTKDMRTARISAPADLFSNKINLGIFNFNLLHLQSRRHLLFVKTERKSFVLSLFG